MSSRTMMPMSLEEIAQAVQGRLIAAPRRLIRLWPPAHSLIHDRLLKDRYSWRFAEERVDGHDYVSKVGAQGAVAAIVDHEIDGAGVPQIVVEDTVPCLGRVGQAQYRTPACVGTPFTVIGITGSVGKTTTKDLMKALLAAHRTDDWPGRIVQQ